MTFDFGEDRFGGGDLGEGAGLYIVLFHEGVDFAGQFFDAGE